MVLLKKVFKDRFDLYFQSLYSLLSKGFFIHHLKISFLWSYSIRMTSTLYFRYATETRKKQSEVSSKITLMFLCISSENESQNSELSCNVVQYCSG